MRDKDLETTTGSKTTQKAALYPRDYLENLNARIRMWEACHQNDDPTAQEYRTTILNRSTQSILFWINLYCYTFDPRLSNNLNGYVPFITYDFQDAYIEEVWAAINEGRDVLTEKSRDMGATWMVLAIFVYGWLFHGHHYLVGSMKQELVDTIGNIDSLMERLRAIIIRLPDWMLPRGFDKDKHLSFLKIINPEKGNQIVGQATTPNFSRSGRYKAIFFDEYAHVEDAPRIWVSSGNSSPCRLPVSTPQGVANHFAELRNSGRIKVMTLHWKEHPKKDEEWYAREVERTGKQAAAQELDIDYLASAGRQRFDRVVLGQMHKATKEPERVVGNLRIYKENDPRCRYVLGVDTSEGLESGDNSVVVVLNCATYSVDAIYMGKPPVDQFAKEVKNIAEGYGEGLVVIESNGHGLAVLNDLKTIYGNIYYRKTFEEYGDRQTTKLGWRTDKKTKPMMIAGVEEALRANLICPDKELIGELMTYIVNEDGSTSAQYGCHDDGVMALACALQGYQESERFRVEEVKKKLPRYCVQRSLDRQAEELAEVGSFWE